MAKLSLKATFNVTNGQKSYIYQRFMIVGNSKVPFLGRSLATGCAVAACANRATNNKAVHIYSIFIILLSNLINNPNYPTY